ncbi:MAG: hypothetical protein ACRD1I_07245 [Terriglobia bacterium]
MMSLIRHSLVWAAALLLFAAGKGWGQALHPAGAVERSGALQSKLNEWRQRLSGTNLGLPPLTDEQRQLLERGRSACLGLIGSINSEIAGLQGHVTREGEVRLELDLIRLQGRLFSLHGSLERS